MLRVSFQGERGAFSEDAAIKLFGPDIDFLPCLRIRDAFQSVADDKAEFGVVPVENSQAGSINETYDLLLAYPLHIFAEVVLRVSHCLMALPGQRVDDIGTVYSHPQALAQCEEYLNRLDVEVVPSYDTAGSAKMISEKGLRGCAAVASGRAASIYGLEVLAPEIETNVNNYTKFFAVSKRQAEAWRKNKTSLVFAARHVPGALYSILGIFASRNINLTKLESRPSRSKPWEYIFYADFEGCLEDEVPQEALGELKSQTLFVKILGSYPQAQ